MPLTVTAQFPSEIEAVLRETIAGDLNHYAREALAVQMYREGKLTHGQFQRCLGVSSYEADGILKRHGGVDDLNADELAAQVDASARVRGVR